MDNKNVIEVDGEIFSAKVESILAKIAEFPADTPNQIKHRNEVITEIGDFMMFLIGGIVTDVVEPENLG